jgi:hypothetical protein
VIIWNLACLREAASAKAGAWDLVLSLSDDLFNRFFDLLFGQLFTG